MKRILSALGIFFALSGISVLSLESASRTLERGSVPTPPSVERPVVARILFASSGDLERLAGELDVWEVHHQEGYLVARLHSNQYEALIQAGYQVEIDEAKTALLNQPLQALPNQTAGIPGYPCYRTVEETYADLSRLAADHPDLAAWVDIGDSWDKVTSGGPTGYDTHVLVLTNDAVPGPKPKFFLMAAIHARELTTAELAARFAEHLVVNYGTDPDVTWLLDYSEVHIVPIANPDGHKQAEAGEYWRKNTDNDDGCTTFPFYGTDLNRNSSFHWGGAATHPCFETYQGSSAASEPETQAIQNYATSIFPDQRDPGNDEPAPDDAMGIFISLHSYGQLVLFPYGFDPTPAPNHTQLESLGRKFGHLNGYQVCQSGEPGCLYATTGATDDWVYGELGVAAYTFELGTAFFQDCFTFENAILSKNLKALLYAFKSARRPYQTPAGPDSLDVAVMPATIVAGAAVTVTAVADDARYDSHGWGNEPVQNIAAARYTVDAPAWITGVISYAMTPADGAFNASSESILAVVDTTGWLPGRHTLFIESQDADGNWGVPSGVFLWVVLPPDSAIAGTVREKDSDLPIAGATTRLSNNALVEEQITDSEGFYAFSVYSGTYTLTASASAYFTTVLTQVVASSGMTTTQDIVLWSHHRHYLPFIVKNAEP